MKTAIVFIADGSEEIEALSPIDYLRRAGVAVTVIAVGTEETKVVCAHKVAVLADMTLKDYLARKEALPDAVVVPGGMPGASNIAASGEVLSLINAANAAGKLVCSICASPAVVLARTEALKGRKWTCYPGMEEEAGAYRPAYTAEPVTVDGTLITGRGPGAAEQFSMAIVKALAGEAVYKKVKEGSLQR